MISSPVTAITTYSGAIHEMSYHRTWHLLDMPAIFSRLVLIIWQSPEGADLLFHVQGAELQELVHQR